MKGYRKWQLPSYLDEFMWREKFGISTGAALNGIIVDIDVD